MRDDDVTYYSFSDDVINTYTIPSLILNYLFISQIECLNYINFLVKIKDGNIVVTCVSSIRDNNVINAILSIVRTVFVAVVLTFGAV